MIALIRRLGTDMEINFFFSTFLFIYFKMTTHDAESLDLFLIVQSILYTCLPMSDTNPFTQTLGLHLPLCFSVAFPDAAC